MTRVTSFGRKRTYLQAGFENDGAANDKAAEPSGSRSDNPPHSLPSSSSNQGEAVNPPKKKRKRTPKSKRDGHAAEKLAAGTGVSTEGDSSAPTINGPTVSMDGAEPLKMTNKRRKLEAFRARRAKKQAAEAAARQTPAEMRRLRRIQEKLAQTTCFACRQTGHAARDCPSAKSERGEGSSKAVGICYRCGSQRHSLSRCKKPENPQDPYPFASCFVCNGKGHLASACPQNASKGIYPNGGCCKLCKETTHLAKDCHLKKKITEDPAAVVGTGRDTGADEDDFHVIKRQTGDFERQEKMLEKRVFQSARAATVPAKPPAKKVVVF